MVIGRVKGRRGLSAVLTMAFILAGAILGVVLLWVFASKSIQRTNEIISPDCFTADLDVLNCKAYGFCSYVAGITAYNSDILVRRGIGRADLRGIRFSF